MVTTSSCSAATEVLQPAAVVLHRPLPDRWLLAEDAVLLDHVPPPVAGGLEPGYYLGDLRLSLAERSIQPRSNGLVVSDPTVAHGGSQSEVDVLQVDQDHPLRGDQGGIDATQQEMTGVEADPHPGPLEQFVHMSGRLDLAPEVRVDGGCQAAPSAHFLQAPDRLPRLGGGTELSTVALTGICCSQGQQ